CCSRHAIENCPAHRFYSSLQDKIDLEFDTSISGLLSLEEYDNADIFNSIEERVYIIDNITHEILFINESAKQAYKGNYRNKKCYEVIFERTTPCPECDSIKCDYQTAHIRQLDTDDECLTVKSKIIPFRGREAYLTVTFDITSSQRQKKELERALLAENLLTDCIRCLQGSSDLSLAINDILAMIGQFTQADRSYISTIDGRVTTNKYEWCAQGVIPQINNFQNLDVKAISRWFDFFTNRQCVVVPNVDAIQSSYSPEYELMVNKGVHNYIVAPLYLENKLFGYLGMDNPPIEKSKNIVSLLMALTYFITASIQAYNDKKLLEKLSYVDSMSGLKNRNAYILDIDNYKNNKENQKVGVVYIDINRLKEINDNFGHLSGDKTIVTTAK
ncbi:MAG: diguanylate cyclase, partial [Clostridia bacterium]